MIEWLRRIRSCYVRFLAPGRALLPEAAVTTLFNLERQLKEIHFVNFMQIFFTCYIWKKRKKQVLRFNMRLAVGTVFHFSIVSLWSSFVPTEAALHSVNTSRGLPAKWGPLQSFDATDTPVTFISKDRMKRLLLDCLNALKWNSFKAVVECATERLMDAITYVVYSYNNHCLRQGNRGNRSALAVTF